MQFEYEIESTLFEWRGPAPFYFVGMPKELTTEIKALAKTLSYGWGVVPASIRIGETAATTSLIPRDRAFLIPIKDAVRKANDLHVGDNVKMLVVLGVR